MMDNTKIKKGGIDTIIAYIVVILPLVYILAFIIAIIYHFSVQSYVAQVAKELSISASTHGEIKGEMKERVYERLEGLDVGDFEIAITTRNYDDDDNEFGSPTYLTGSAAGHYIPCRNIPDLDGDDFGQKDTIAVYIRSTTPSLLATVANFGLFGGGGTSELKYSAFREEIVRYADSWWFVKERIR